MKYRKYRLLPILAAFLLAGCGGENISSETFFSESGTGEQQKETTSAESGTEEQQTETVFSASGSEATEGQTPSDDFETRIKALEVRTWQDICGESISAEEAMRNSAKENFEYLTWSGNGEIIYYSDLSANKIYACTADGEEKNCLYENAGVYMQVRDGWLYAKISAENKNVRINCETGESEDVFAEPCGEHFFLQNQLYFNTEQGFCALNEEDGSRTYYENEFEMVNVQVCQNIILGTAVKGIDTSFFLKGYLLGYDISEAQCFLVKEKALWFVAAGDWLSYFDSETRSRHVLNMATGEDTDLGVYAQYIASDGTKLYYQGKDNQIFCWDGQEAAALAAVEDEAQHFFLTPTHLYWMRADNSWGYYDLERGKSGNL